MAIDSPITAALFWSKVNIPDPQANCWTWRGTLNERGYGRFRVNGKWHFAHRVSYQALKGPIPDGLIVRHMCHNTVCCNPDHLDVGTSKDNAQDAIDAGRFARGEANGNTRLTEADVIAIRRNADHLTTRQLAARYGVATGTVSGIRTGKVWRHVAA